MRKSGLFLFLIIGLTVGVFAQQDLPDIGIQKNLALGVVESVGTEKVVMETKDGKIDIVLQSVTVFKRLSPDNLKLSAATDAALTDVAVGDRLLVTGKVSDDQKSIYSSKVFLVKGTELEEQAEKRRREWQTRGIAGKVTAIDPVAGTLTVKISSLAAAGTELGVMPSENTRFLRYSQDSAKYSDAVESEFSKIAVGDTLQALGDRSEDGKTFSAEEILTGGFVTVAGVVKTIDAEKSEVTITEFGSDKEIKIIVNKNSLLKKFPEQFARRMAMFLRFRQAGGGSAPQTEQASQRRGQGRRPGGGMGRGPSDINQIAARFPAISITDLVAGDQIAVSSPKPEDPSRVTAIKLFAGVGPIIAAQSTSGRGRAAGVSGSLSIPGLDSFDF